MTEAVIQEAKEEINVMKSALESLGYLKIDEAKSVELIGIISKLLLMVEGQDDKIQGLETELEELVDMVKKASNLKSLQTTVNLNFPPLDAPKEMDNE